MSQNDSKYLQAQKCQVELLSYARLHVIMQTWLVFCQIHANKYADCSRLTV